MVYSYVPQGVCAKEIHFEVEEGIIQSVNFIGGCKGNLAAISTLVRGMTVEEVVCKLRGNRCQNETSCADQLARALESALQK
ncbi:MAG: TIGR03905 family TSCPD domain-containing protein [Negativicutes bacterium]|nr:TIGR03905 family TSCPD domain-containing protein [Negativicutes bacterium]